VSRNLFANLGIRAYAIGAISLGVIGLVWGDFASNWQLVSAGVPGRTAFAYLAAVLELGAGIALFWPRASRAAAAVLTAVYSVFTLLWVIKALAAPLIYDSWGNVFEELSLVIAGLVLMAALAPRDSALPRREALVGRSYGICVVSFGVVHVVYFSGLPAWVPNWIPPGQVFWAAATTVCFFLAAASIFSGILSPLATRLLTAMILGFELLVWLPKLFAAPHDHFSWAGNGIATALAGAAWAISDSIVQRATLKATAKESPIAIRASA
jgi:uncharacterized membrane protein YphA (DoxX/SURF4 family)